MKPYIKIFFKGFWFDFGWYKGESFSLFKIEVFSIDDAFSYYLVTDMITFFSIQILKLLIAVGYDRGIK